MHSELHVWLISFHDGGPQDFCWIPRHEKGIRAGHKHGHSAQLFASCLVNVEVAGEEEMDDIVDVGGKGPGQEMGQNTVEPQGRVKSDKREKNRKISSGLQGQRSYSSVKYQVAV